MQAGQIFSNSRRKKTVNRPQLIHRIYLSHMSICAADWGARNMPSTADGDSMTVFRPPFFRQHFFVGIFRRHFFVGIFSSAFFRPHFFVYAFFRRAISRPVFFRTRILSSHIFFVQTFLRLWVFSSSDFYVCTFIRLTNSSSMHIFVWLLFR